MINASYYNSQNFRADGHNWYEMIKNINSPEFMSFSLIILLEFDLNYPMQRFFKR